VFDHEVDDDEPEEDEHDEAQVSQVGRSSLRPAQEDAGQHGDGQDEEDVHRQHEGEGVGEFVAIGREPPGISAPHEPRFRKTVL
jgi:hypothetical protein